MKIIRCASLIFNFQLSFFNLNKMLLNFIDWNVDPVMVHIGSFALRYYSLGFLFAFVLGYLIFVNMFKREKVESKYLENLLIWMFVATLVGARLGHCLFYADGEIHRLRRSGQPWCSHRHPAHHLAVVP